MYVYVYVSIHACIYIYALYICIIYTCIIYMHYIYMHYVCVHIFICIYKGMDKKKETLSQFIFDHRPDLVIVNSSGGQNSQV
jgi:hypothetical protein